MEQNTNINTDEREIDLKILFAYVFKEWRKILIGGLVFCMLFAFYKGYKLVKANTATNSTNTSEVSDEQKKSIDETKASIAYLEDYMKNSIYANIDPYNETVTTTTISILTSSNDNISTLLESTNHVNQIVQSYSTYIKSEIDYTSLANTLGITEQDLAEIISVKPDFDSDTIALKVIGSDKKQTEKIADYIIEAVNNNETNIKSQFGEYTSKISKLVTNIVVDQSLISPAPATGSTAVFDANVAMSNALVKKSTLESSLKAQQSATIVVAPSVSTIIKSSSKYGIIGLLFGMMLMILIYTIKLILGEKLLSENDLKAIYKIKILTVFPMNVLNSKKSKFDTVIYNQIDSAYGIGFDTCFQKAMTNITEYSTGMNEILLIGSNVSKDIELIEKELKKLNKNINFTSSIDINSNAEELKKLKSADGVVVVAQRNSTRINDLTKTIETIQNWGKTVIGSIVL